MILLQTIIIQALLLIAIGLLVPQPCLISGLLRHQRKLPYWYTLVWNSHQLIPNKAYSPQGRLLRKRQDSVFERDYVSTPSIQDLSSEAELISPDISPLPSVGYRQHACISDSWRPQAGLGSRHDGIRSAPSCTNFIKLHDDSVESVLSIPIRMRASS